MSFDNSSSCVRFGSTFVFADTTGTTEDIYQDDIVSFDFYFWSTVIV